MRKTILAGILLATTLLLSGCAEPRVDRVIPTGQASMPTQKPTDPVKVTVVGNGEGTLMPGVSVGTAPSVRNDGAQDIYCCLKVEIPVFPAESVALEPGEPQEDPVPLIRLTLAEGWTLVGSATRDGIRSEVYCWGDPARLSSGEVTEPVFSDWRMPNFRVRDGLCGDTPYAELLEKADRIRITGYGLQADHIGTGLTPETVWIMITGNGGI